MVAAYRRYGKVIRTEFSRVWNVCSDFICLDMHLCHYVFHYCYCYCVAYLFFNNLFNCSCNYFCCSENHICIVFILCSVSFIACVVLCAEFYLSVVCYFVLCLIVLSLPPGKYPFAV
jgi:hypothetical protein